MCLEHPEDPGVYPYPSVWSTTEMQELERRTGCTRGLLDQCMYDGPSKKPTCFTNNVPELSEECQRCGGGHTHARSFGLGTEKA